MLPAFSICLALVKQDTMHSIRPFAENIDKLPANSIVVNQNPLHPVKYNHAAGVADQNTVRVMAESHVLHFKADFHTGGIIPPEFGTVAGEACHLSVIGVAVVDRAVEVFFVVPLEANHAHFSKLMIHY